MAALLRVNDHTENYREAKGLCLFLNYLHKYELLGLHFQNSNPLLHLSMSTVLFLPSKSDYFRPLKMELF